MIEKVKEPEVRIGFQIVKKVLEYQNTGKPIWFSRLVEIFEEEIPKEEISKGRTIRTIVGHWLDAFENLSVIGYYYGEYEPGKAGKLCRIVNEILLRRLEEEYQKKQKNVPEVRLSDLFILSDLFMEVLKE